MAEENEATPKKAPAKKPAAKATAAKKPAADKAPAKKPAAKATAAKKPAADKAPAKAAASKQAVAETAPAKATTATAKSAAATKAAAKSAAAKATPSAEQPKVTTLKMHHLRPAPGSHAAKIRVGRGEGGKRGKTAGRGTKGTGARYQVPAAFEGGQTPLHMRIPKLRGFKSPFKVRYQVVNLDQLAELFPKGGKVTKADLIEKGAVRNNLPVKVLGDGEIAVKVTLVDADAVSRSAKTKIEAAGGTVNEG
ncbi:50S ribosomal protein L15 [Demequina sp.]|uniref:50S ribosomal protein L15 n=1 Tax=Demequina sp. TaxID=2050685 RepID=UPI0025C05122|nr:50S ribosomal protein L15 [Demequina sp.]